MIEGELFITPHAVRQFQARICSTVSYEQAREIMIAELQKHVVSTKRLSDHSLGVRVRGGDWSFRAVVVPGKDKAAVVTILKSGK